ncbi:MAG: exodeoxyribonuclease V subunit alpha [Actinomycetales bacterium]|nr:MAG: exodeoxyribonuclease V subunit alpha [Actinomycetales bacterium]
MTAESADLAAEQPQPIDPFSRQSVRGADGLLGHLNTWGVLEPADVHVARTICRLAQDEDDAVLLAVSLAVRGVRLGSSCVHLGSVVADLRLQLPHVTWPTLVDDPVAWLARVSSSPVASGTDRVLVVEGPLLYLARYHGLEVSLCDRLLSRLTPTPPKVDEALLRHDLHRLFGEPGFEQQRAAADAAARSWTTVLTGGPGTGKTTTIARLLVALESQHRASGSTRPLSVGLATPTGKASARMREALVGAATDTPAFSAEERAWLQGLQTVTLHRLLGARPDHRTAFRHHAGQKLPHDVIVVDETSMVSLLMMERLVQAVPASCRLVLVGDADQLASVEAGAVLHDVVEGLGGLASPWVTRLSRGHRFDGAVSDLAEAVVEGDADRALAVLTGPDEHVRLVAPEDVSTVIDARPRQQARAIARAASEGDAAGALALLAEHRLLCAHRDGPAGVSHWNEQLEREVRPYPDAQRPWYVGRPVLVTRNDATLRVNNGDVGVTLDDADRLVAHLDTGLVVSAARLASVQSAYASTVHRSQGSEFEHVTLLLPDEESLVLSRELLYTAVTRTRSSLTVVARPETVRRAVEHRTARASGVAGRLAAALETRD